MALKWIPLKDVIAQDIAEAEAKLQETKNWTPAPKFAQADIQPLQTFEPTPSAVTENIPSPVTPKAVTPQVVVKQVAQPTTVSTTISTAQATTPATTTATTPTKTAETPTVIQNKPIWQRALEIFAAPFVWVDNYIIKPGLSVIANPIIPNLKREVGEDYWAFKKREWEAWQTPGVDLDMPWGKWRIDLKGIAEQLPWLLLPGVGTAGKTVGGVVKGATGLAGKLAKMGQAGAVVGKALELSPWGMVERGTAKVLGGAVKLATKESKKLGAKVGAKFVGVIPEKKISPAILQLTEDFKLTVMPARKAFEAAEPAVRKAQESALRSIQDKVVRGELTVEQAIPLMKEARSDGIKSKFAVDISKNYTKEQMSEVMLPLFKAVESGYVKADAVDAMQDLFLLHELPEPHHIKEFAKVYGTDFANAVGELAKQPKGVAANVIDALNIPRATLSSLDFSATLRQGLILGLAHPLKAGKAFVNQVKAFASEKLALDMDAVLKSDPLYPEFVNVAKGYIAPIEKAAPWGAMEESFASRVAEGLPFIRRSERGFITYLNELRFSVYKDASSTWKALGAGEKELEVLGRFINDASGRGTLPLSLDQYAPLMNTFFFSPKLQWSRADLLGVMCKMIFSDKPYMRKEAARALVTFLGGGAALLSLLKTSGIGTVETDPRSSDFAKLKIGETRFDIWTGYAQYARFVTQMLTGEKKEAYGNMSKANRAEVAGRFLQSKTSPASGLLLDLLRGEDYAGKPLAKDTAGLIETTKAKMFPLALQDFMDAAEQNGINPLAVTTGIAGGLGVGTLTYVNEFVVARNKIAKELGYESWSQIDPIKQKEIEKFPQLQQAAIEYDRQMMGTTWGDWRNVGNAAEEVFTEMVNQAVAKYKQTQDGVQFRDDISEAFTARKGAYAARKKDDRFEEIVARLNLPDDAERLLKLGPEQTAINTYEEALFSDDMYDEFGDYRFDEAEVRKAQLKESFGDELYNYVEEYRGLKYEDLPVEYQELAQAKIVMKPYWDIERQARELKGWTDDQVLNVYQQRWLDSFVAKMRKRMKLIAFQQERATGEKGLYYYYQKFYNTNV